VFFGLLGPITARYLAKILEFAGTDAQGVTVSFPDPVPADGIAQYVSNVLQLGTLVVVVVAASALAFDAIPEMGVFLRTRIPHVWRILVPRLVVPFIATSVAFVIGTLAAWYETWVLLGALSPRAVLLGTMLGILFFAFVIAVVAAVAQWTTSLLATIMGSLGVLLVLPIVGIVDGIGRWLPTVLGNALTELTAKAPPSDFWRPTLTAIIAIPVLLWLAERGARRRET
jgi:ABC-2 type transport system permease protein